MVVSTFFISNKDGRVRFFKENFLLANIKLDMIFEISFLSINNIYIDFRTWNL